MHFTDLPSLKEKKRTTITQLDQNYIGSQSMLY